ncbi:hypothetical protein TSUD_370310 [Trifolium subterraneum]|uniref:Uncharacterized protein n=1 Tax=Trifolium subterraneum TaxID=3900 RepID=A0A2Z6NBA9_TRISU|nr:hypothetical protein TSUD_370310 [Trifolium subterraneum]
MGGRTCGSVERAFRAGGVFFGGRLLMLLLFGFGFGLSVCALYLFLGVGVQVEHGDTANSGSDLTRKGFEVWRMFKSLNAICFGHYRVHARVARFDCNDTVAGRSLGMEKDGVDKHNVTTTAKTKKGDDYVVDSVKGGSGSPEDV